MAGLMGLSPQEISAISGRRQVAESQRMEQLRFLTSMLGSQKAGGIEREKLDLAREKFEFEKDPPMIQMKTESGEIYEVPRAAQAEGIKAKAEVDERLRTGRISQAEHDAWMKPVTISLPDGAGGWVPYETQSGMLQGIAAGIKNLQDIRVSGVEEERKRKGIAALGETTIGGIEDVPLSTLAATMPGGVIPALVAKPRPGTAAAALKPEERRKLMIDQENSAFKMLEEGEATSDASVSAYNDRSKTLNYPSMMFKYKGRTKSIMGIPYIGGEGLVEVKLPVIDGVQMTPANVSASAKRKEISVDERLREIYEGMLIIEQAKKKELR